ncbi:MAG: DUF6527 family protein [Bacillota bacterium]
MRHNTLTHRFVDCIPTHLEDGVVYVSIPFAMVAHKCCCGCGNEVFTPLSPTDWRLTYDGQTISLAPSIGNWGFACRSHYWIEHNRVKWAARWSQERIAAGRAKDILAKESYYGNSETGDKKPKDKLGRKYF